MGSASWILFQVWTLDGIWILGKRVPPGVEYELDKIWFASSSFPSYLDLQLARKSQHFQQDNKIGHVDGKT